jgi:hypothetical protein
MTVPFKRHVGSSKKTRFRDDYCSLGLTCNLFGIGKKELGELTRAATHIQAVTQVSICSNKSTNLFKGTEA